ncbi:hypothetical protein ACFLQ5_02260 [Bacteroidota bacterium]
MKAKRIILYFVIFVIPISSFCQDLNMNKNLVAEITSKFESVPNPIEYAKKESINGTMDFEKVLENEKGWLFVFDGIGYNKDNFKILLWGIVAKKIGITSLKIAKETWESIYNRPLSGSELKAFKKGYKCNKY